MKFVLKCYLAGCCVAYRNVAASIKPVAVHGMTRHDRGNGSLKRVGFLLAKILG